MPYLSLILLSIFMPYTLEAQNFSDSSEINPLENQSKIFQYLRYVSTSNWIDEPEQGWNKFITELEALSFNFHESEEKKTRIYHNYIQRNENLTWKHYLSPAKNGWLDWIYHENQDSIQNQWKVMRNKIYRWQGSNTREALVYNTYKGEDKPTTVNLTFRHGTYIVNIGLELDFPTPESLDELDIEKKIKVRDEYLKLEEILKLLVENLVHPDEWIKKPLDGKQLTAEQRLYGFTQFWTEVKYNFAFFDQVPDLDWDKVLYEYLPLIQKDQSNEEYYRTLKLICAKLGDGHTNIYPPTEDVDMPGLELKNFGNKAFVVNAKESLQDRIPLGSEIISVEGQATEQYLRKKVFPYISSSTDHIRYNWGIRDLLDGKKDSEVQFEIRTPDGEIRKERLKRNRQEGGAWIKGRKGWQLFQFAKTEGDFAHIKLNSFSRENIIEEFEKRVDSIKACKGVIIDLRGNGGGSSSIGYAILNHFTKKPYKGSQWRTREHRASYKAWGKFVDESLPFEELSEFDKRSKLTLEGEYWYVAEPNEYKSEVKDIIKLPVVVLIGNNTASAAEDFLVALDQVGIAKLIGSPTFGSTGQPLMMDLPGGGSARICTKRDTYPDGREFVGYGIPPDYKVAQTVEDYLNDKDVVLEYAVNFLKENPDFSQDKK
ncbi:MAG: S41 family peptidase [Bacteroidota bacterium]